MAALLRSRLHDKLSTEHVEPLVAVLRQAILAARTAGVGGLHRLISDGTLTDLLTAVATDAVLPPLLGTDQRRGILLTANNIEIRADVTRALDNAVYRKVIQTFYIQIDNFAAAVGTSGLQDTTKSSLKQRLPLQGTPCCSHIPAGNGPTRGTGPTVGSVR